MNLKGSQRAGGVDQATHLLNSFDNDEVKIIEIRGTVASDLLGFMSEAEAIASGTKCKQPFYSLSISPPFRLTSEQYRTTIAAIEQELGLSGQPRAIVLHRKKGREHCHVVWSRIDFRSMTAIHLSHDRLRLQKVRRKLADKFGYQLPDGPRETPHNTLAENAQAEVSGISPEERRFDITEAYMASDNGQSFINALSELGYTLAQGDKRGFVVVDRDGLVHSLTRQIEGVRTKHIHEKLAPLLPDTLPTVQEIQKRLEPQSDHAAEPSNENYFRELRQQQAKRRADLHRDVRSLEKTQAEELRLLQTVHCRELEPSFVRVFLAVCRRCRAVPGLGAFVAHMRHQAVRNRAARHARELEAIRQRHNRDWLELKRRDRLLILMHHKERHSFEIAMRRKTSISMRKVETFAVNGLSMTKPSPLSLLPDEDHIDPEIEALEREYMRPRVALSSLFNVASMNIIDNDEDGGKEDGNLEYDEFSDPNMHNR